MTIIQRSLNDWPAIKYAADPRLRTIQIPGLNHKVTLRRAVAPVFAAFLADWQKRMPARLSLRPGPVDGWVYRQARLADGFSNHASGTAVDVLYKSVLPADNKRHMTAAEKRILDTILSEYVTDDGHRIFANGEWWGTADGMHTELSQAWDRGAKRNTTLRDVKNVQRRLGIDPDGHRTK